MVITSVFTGVLKVTKNETSRQRVTLLLFPLSFVNTLYIESFL